MKKLYSLLFLTVVAMMGFVAQAADVTFTFKVNLPEQVTLDCYGHDLTLTGETNTFTLPQYSYVYITTKTGYYVNSFTNEAGTPVGSTTYFMPEDGTTYVLDVININDARDKSFTVTVDDASMVSARFSGTGETVNLQTGTHTYKFSPTLDRTLELRGNSPKGLYQVTLDGVNIAGSYGAYSVNITDGCTVDIVSQFPDIPCKITFTYTDPAAEGFWTGVNVNNVAVENFDGKSVTVQAGDQVQLYGNTNDYKWEKIEINGQPVQYFYSPYSLTVTEDTEVALTARPYGKVKFTLNIDNPEFVKVYNGSRWGGISPMSGLIAGDNALEFSETNTTLDIAAQPGCFITSITDGEGNTLAQSFNVTEGMKIYVVTGEIVLDQEVVVWVDNKTGLTYFGGAVLNMDSEHKTYELDNGYNIIKVSQQYSTVGFSWYGSTVNQLYLNGERQSGDTNYTLTLAGGDVVKIFLQSNPETVAVTLTGAGNTQALAGVEVKRDVLTDVTNWQGAVENVFAGTVYTIKADEASVKLNGTDVAKGEDGLYAVTIPAGESAAEITVTGTDAIAGVTVDEAAADDAVYNFQGICVGRRADLPSLPAGLYIVGDEKTLVK